MFHEQIRRLRLLALGAAVASLVMSTAQPVAAVPVGEELTLSYDQQTWLNSASGDPVITGTIECPTVAQDVYISIDVTQDGGKAWGSGNTTETCDAPEVRWLINADGSGFDAGSVSIEGYANYEVETTDAERSDVSSLTVCTRIGTMEDDEFTGTQKADKICGLDGDDKFIGRGGNDILRGGDGDDSVNGSAGNDVIYGGYGEDHLLGGFGNDKLSGNQQKDYLNGNAGDDSCDGGPGKDTLESC